MNIETASDARSRILDADFAQETGELARRKILQQASQTMLAQANASLEEEVSERTRAETELTAANEELTAMNEEMIHVTEELQQANQQMLLEIEVRQATESKLLLREKQYRAMFRLISDTEAGFDAQMQG